MFGQSNINPETSIMASVEPAASVGAPGEEYIVELN